MEYMAAGLLSFIVTFALTRMLIPRLTKAGIVGTDENKADRPKVPEMGGIAIVSGFSAGILLAIFFGSFFSLNLEITYLLAALITICFIAFIGVIDDLLDMPQWLKAILPLFAAIPLVAVKAAGSTAIFLPFIGLVDFGIIYMIALIPLGIAVASNLTNMLAGFNGMEAGMGAVIFAAMSLIALANGFPDMSVMSLSMLGALLAFLLFNLHPSRIFPGDVGNLTIGCVLASTVIIGNLESAGVILMVPYVADFFIKAANRFPHTYQELRDGKLFPKEGKVRGLVHLVMKAFGGISERNLVFFFIGLELVFAAIVLALYL